MRKGEGEGEGEGGGERETETETERKAGVKHQEVMHFILILFKISFIELSWAHHFSLDVFLDVETSF